MRARQHMQGITVFRQSRPIEPATFDKPPALGRHYVGTNSTFDVEAQPRRARSDSIFDSYLSKVPDEPCKSLYRGRASRQAQQRSAVLLEPWPDRNPSTRLAILSDRWAARDQPGGFAPFALASISH